MLTPDYHNDTETTKLLILLKELRKIRKNMGGYIEHFYHNENTIVIKLTNGVLEIQEKVFEKYTSKDVKPDTKELEKLADGFVNSTIL